MWRARMASVTTGLVLIVAARSAAGEPSKEELRRADILFQEGRKLMADGRVEDGCKKLEESRKLAPGLGTSINLGGCYEQSGHLALAAGTYFDASSIAHVAGRFDREREANAHLTAVESRIVRLVLRDPGEPGAIAVTVEGAPAVSLGAGNWAIDPGAKRVVVTVLGKVRFDELLEGRGGDRKEIILQQEQASAPALASTPPAASAPSRDDERRGGGQRVVGAVLASTGVLALGVAGVFAVLATSKDSEAGTHCDESGCDSAGHALGEEAKSRGNIATVMVIGGAVLVAAGAVIYLVAPRSGGSVTLSPRVAPGIAALALRASF